MKWEWIPVILMTAATGINQVGLTSSGSIWHRLMELVVYVCGAILAMLGRQLVGKKEDANKILPLLALVFFVSACSPVPALYKATTTAAVMTSTGYRSLDVVDTSREKEMQGAARSGNLKLALQLREEWRPKYRTVRAVLDDASAVIASAYAAIPVIELATNQEQRKEVNRWTSTLGKLVLDVIKVLGDAGIKLPLGGG